MPQKPGCHSEILQYFRAHPETNVTSASQVAIVGDRLFTDIMMANMMGSYGVWIREGVVEETSLVRCSFCNTSLNLYLIEFSHLVYPIGEIIGRVPPAERLRTTRPAQLL